MLADLIEVASVGASKDTRLQEPLDYPRPRYPEATPEGADMAEVAVFFGMTYRPQQPDQEDTAE